MNFNNVYSSVQYGFCEFWDLVFWCILMSVMKLLEWEDLMISPELFNVTCSSYGAKYCKRVSSDCAAADTVNSETILCDNKRNASLTFSWQIAIVDKSFSICTITHLYEENERKTSAPAYESSFIPQRRAANIVLSVWFVWIERASGASQRTTENNAFFTFADLKTTL